MALPNQRADDGRPHTHEPNVVFSNLAYAPMRELNRSLYAIT